MDPIQQQLAVMQEEIKQLREELAQVKAGKFNVLACDTITCKAWQVVDKAGNVRITAATLANGESGIGWFDNNGKPRIDAGTFAAGEVGVRWSDTNGNIRMTAFTQPNGNTSMQWLDTEGETQMNVAVSSWRRRIISGCGTNYI
jgi:hypothetical protein